MLQTKMQIIKKLKDKETRSIAIIMHNKPDGDSIGSAVALEKTLKHMGKKVVDIIIQDKIHKKFAPIIGQNRVNKTINPPEGRRYDVLIMVDFSDPNRTINNLRKYAKFIIVLDHHIYNKPFGDLYFCEKEASTGILVYKIIKTLTPITPEIANAIYLTIKDDTGDFKNVNTDSRAHQVASELLIYGANINLINTIYENKSLQFIYLMGSTLSDVKIDKKYKIAYLQVSRDKIKKSKILEEEVSLLIDEIKNIKDIDIAYLFVEGISNIRISARSKIMPVNKILEHFGGGGHPNAAGCAIEDSYIYDVVNSVLTFTKEYIDNNK